MKVSKSEFLLINKNETVSMKVSESEFLLINKNETS